MYNNCTCSWYKFSGQKFSYIICCLKVATFQVLLQKFTDFLFFPLTALFMPLYLWGLPPPSCQGPRVRGVITGQSSLPQNMPKNTNYISHMNSLSFSLFLTTFWLHALILQLHLSHSLSSSLIFYLLIFSPFRSGNLLYLIFLILF